MIKSAIFTYSMAKYHLDGQHLIYDLAIRASRMANVYQTQLARDTVPVKRVILIPIRTYLPNFLSP